MLPIRCTSSAPPVPRLPVPDPDTDLDQLVVGERGLELGDQRRRQPGFADHDDRLELMAEAAQVFLLGFAKHRVVAAGGSGKRSEIVTHEQTPRFE